MRGMQIGAVFLILNVLSGTSAFCAETASMDDGPVLEADLMRPNPEGLIWTTGFEEGGFQFVIGGRPEDNAGPLWMNGQFQGPYAAAFSSELVRSGDKSLRLEWRASEVNPDKSDNTSKKAMIHFAKAATPAETDRWYGFSIYLPSADFPVERFNVLFFQVHATPDFSLKEPHRRPPLSLTIREGILNCWHSYDLAEVSPKNDNIVSNGSLEPICPQTDLWDRWTDFVVHAKFSLKGNGAIEIWQDGKKVLDLHDIMLGYNDKVGGYPSWGIYSYNGGSHRIAFVDEVRVGDQDSSYEQVAPGKLNGTQVPMSMAGK